MKKRGFYTPRGGTSNRTMAVLGLAGAVISVFLPWINVQLFGTSIGNISFYYIATHMNEFSASMRYLGGSNNTAALIAVILVALAIAVTLAIQAKWYPYGLKMWIPGVMAIGSFVSWYAYLQQFAGYSILESGIQVGYGGWLMLAVGCVWIWSNWN